MPDVTDRSGDDQPLPPSLWAALGLPEPLRQDESLAPEIDHDLLVRLVRRELPEEQARAVYHLIHAFQSWTDAHAQVVTDEFHRQHKPATGGTG
jgi:hypothetical protein